MNPVCVVLCATSVCAVAVSAPAVYDGAVVGAEAVAPFFEAAATQRVDVVGIGDSNQLFGGHGWDEGWVLALDGRFNTYATALLSVGENNGNASSAGAGYRMFSSRSSNAFDYDGAPPQLVEMLYPADGFSPLDYVYIPEGVTRTVTNHGLFVQTGPPIDNSARLTFTTVHALFAGAAPGTGYRPFVRRATAPYSTVYESPAFVQTTGAQWASARSDVIIPPATRNFSLQCMVRRFGQSITGPFLAYYMRVQETDTHAGAAFGSLYANGGKSARDMAQTLLDLPDQTLTLYFATLRADQGEDPHVMIRINTGLNDRNEDLAPIGIDAAPDSPEAFEHHLNLMIDRIRSVWTSNGWPEEELYFLLTVSHPVGNASAMLDDDEELIAYRERAVAIAQQTPRCVAIDLSRITSADELAANDWYHTPSDRNHLKIAAFLELADRELCALQSGRSWYDADGDGSIAPEDLYALESWVGTPPTDAPPDLSAQGLARAVRFGELTDTLTAP